MIDSELTPKQAGLLDYLQKQIMNTGQTPSLRQAAGDMGVSHTAISQLIKSLEKKGWITRHGRYGRSIHLHNQVMEIPGAQWYREIPIIGRITAGLPMYAQQEWSGTLVVDNRIFRGQSLFALRVTGDSMKNAGILDADLAVCEPRQFAGNGEIVVALIHHEEATVKRFLLHADRIELRPENESYPSKYYTFGEVLIQGKVIGIQRGPEVMEKA